MTFNSLAQTIQKLLLAPEWERQRYYLLARDCWYKTVNAKIARHAHPLSVDRQILYVATQSAPWAQTLSLQRDRLLKQLNSQLPFTLLELRFSTVNWQVKQPDRPQETIASHPSLIVLPNSPETPAKPLDSENKLEELPCGKTPTEALERWLRTIKLRSQSLPLCPCCHVATSIGELERWRVCAYCFAQNQSGERKVREEERGEIV
jgi:predicted nucleic acid-binding Zn ribbon protein